MNPHLAVFRLVARQLRPALAAQQLEAHTGEWLSVAGHFEGASGSFMYHCHILDHEDHTMMRPFVVLPSDILAFHRGHGGAHH